MLFRNAVTNSKHETALNATNNQDKLEMIACNKNDMGLQLILLFFFVSLFFNLEISKPNFKHHSTLFLLQRALQCRSVSCLVDGTLVQSAITQSYLVIIIYNSIQFSYTSIRLYGSDSLTISKLVRNSAIQSHVSEMFYQNVPVIRDIRKHIFANFTLPVD